MTAYRPHSCGRCNARWGGGNTSHCGGCHQTFAAVGTFDRHFRNGACATPGDVGFVVNDNGYWAAPLDAAGRAYFDRIRETKTTT